MQFIGKAIVVLIGASVLLAATPTLTFLGNFVAFHIARALGII